LVSILRTDTAYSTNGLHLKHSILLKEYVLMEMQDKQVNGVTVLSLKGSIDAMTAPKITEYIQGLVANGNINLVADFSGVDYTSSAGLRVLLGAIKETRAQSGDMRLTGVQPDVLKVLNLSGFTNILKLFDDLDAAIASYA
jgi:anti-anti-sigma factor